MPCGEFGRELQSSLLDAGHDCTRIAFNGGDFINALGQQPVCYRDTLAEWPAWVADFVRARHVTDLVCYGDCRHYHRAAIDVLRPLGLRIHILEEGYLRPNWITCEQNGVNGFSTLTAIDVGQLPNHPEPPPEAELKPSNLHYCFSGFLYYLWSFLLTPFFWSYVSHRDLGPMTEAMLWLRRFATWPWRRIQCRHVSTVIDSLDTPVHLVLLQLNGDSQIKVHSDFQSVRHFVKYCIAEFAASGAADALLVFKNHPLDNGVIPIRKVIRREAERHGLEGRVFFVDGGKLVSLLERSISAIAINSTACHQALRRGIPTLLLGRAVFCHPQIVSRMKMADFFRLRPVKNPAHYARLVNYMRETCQFNGGFYSREGRTILMPALVDALGRGGGKIGSREAAGLASKQAS